jgi:hypothetical protein
MKSEWKVDSIIESTKIQKEITKVPLLHSKYLEYLIYFRAKRAATVKKLNIMKAVKRRYYRGEFTQADLNQYNWNQYQGLKPSSSELNQLFELDTDLNELTELVEYWNTALVAAEYIMKAITARGYELKTYVEYERFVNGG